MDRNQFKENEMSETRKRAKYTLEFKLVARGHRVGKERVRRLMQLHGIRARSKHKFVATTDSKHHLPIAPELVQRHFNPNFPLACPWRVLGGEFDW
jgi:transposase InsO family protein